MLPLMRTLLWTLTDGLKITVTMKNRHLMKRVGIILVMLLVTVASQAQQTLRTGYFLEGNSYRYRINPAMMSERNFFSMPLLGNVNIDTKGNLGLSHVVYDAPDGEDLVTFMHPSVSDNEFLGKLDSENSVSLGADFTILAAGFFAFGGYNTIDLGLHSRVGMNIPYDMFKFMKVMGNENYCINDLNINTNNYLDLAIGHSHKITKDLTVGARLKFLFGLAYADVMFDKMELSMTGKQWIVNAQGTADIAMGGAFKHSGDRFVNGTPAVDGYDDAAVSMNGFGLGIDLGAVYDLSNCLTKGLVVSASLNDIGFMNWNKVARAAVSPENPYTFNGFENIAIHDDVPGTTLEDQFDDLKKDLENFFALEDKGESSVNNMLSATLNIGIEYTMPFYDKLSAGILYTGRFDSMYPLHQFSFMANVAPLNWLDMSASVTASNYGAGFGAMANVHLKSFNFFIGTDCFVSKVGKQFIPVDNMNASVSFGINIPFGAGK